TFSEKPIDPNPEGRHEIHSAFRLTGEEYDRAKVFLASKGIKIFKEEDRRSGTFQGRSAYFHDPDHNVIEIMHLVRGPVAEAETSRQIAGGVAAWVLSLSWERLGLPGGLQAKDREEVGGVVDPAAAGRRRTTHEIKKLAVLDAIVREPHHAAVAVEIDSDDPL